MSSLSLLHGERELRLLVSSLPSVEELERAEEDILSAIASWGEEGGRVRIVHTSPIRMTFPSLPHLVWGRGFVRRLPPLGGTVLLLHAHRVERRAEVGVRHLSRMMGGREGRITLTAAPPPLHLF